MIYEENEELKTFHRVLFENSTKMASVPSNSIDLVVTSPPYPMIEMWDDTFCAQNPEIKTALKDGNGVRAFNLMHNILDEVWSEVYRVLKEGAFACINIGDATRTLNGTFQLHSNHTRILSHFLKLGMCSLPNILWRKQTTGPKT